MPSRDPPHNLQAEKSLLGAILIDNAAFEAVRGRLEPNDFFDPLHRVIFDYSARIIDNGSLVTPTTLQVYFQDSPPIDGTMSAVKYLGHLATNATTTINAREYARVIKHCSIRRGLILKGEDMISAAYDAPPDFTPSEQIGEHMRCLEALDAPDTQITAVPVANFAGHPVPEREWHVKGLIPARNATSLGGDGGTGKSLLAAQLAVATVLGRPWLGCEVQQGPVIYLGAEDDPAEMHRRFADIAAEQGIGLEQLQDLHLCCLAGKDAVLAMANEYGTVQPTERWREVRRLVRKFRPALVVYDTLADLFAGNENARGQAQQFVSMLRGLAIETGAAALLLSHPSLAGMASGTGTSGSTAWSNSVRSRLYLDRVREDGAERDRSVRVLRTMKSNYGAIGGEIRLRWFRGAFILDTSPDAAAMQAAKDQQAEAAFLAILADYNRAGKNVSATPSGNYAPTLFDQDERGKPFGRHVLKVAMLRLIKRGRILLDEYSGANGKPCKRLKVA
jgi:RecA-family ATPase